MCIAGCIFTVLFKNEAKCNSIMRHIHTRKEIIYLYLFKFMNYTHKINKCKWGTKILCWYKVCGNITRWCIVVMVGIFLRECLSSQLVRSLCPSENLLSCLNKIFLSLQWLFEWIFYMIAFNSSFKYINIVDLCILC